MAFLNDPSGSEGIAVVEELPSSPRGRFRPFCGHGVDPNLDEAMFGRHGSSSICQRSTGAPSPSTFAFRGYTIPATRSPTGVPTGVTNLISDQSSHHLNMVQMNLRGCDMAEPVAHRAPDDGSDRAALDGGDGRCRHHRASRPRRGARAADRSLRPRLPAGRRPPQDHPLPVDHRCR